MAKSLLALAAAAAFVLGGGGDAPETRAPETKRHPGNSEETTPEERDAQTKLDAHPPEKIAPPPEKRVGVPKTRAFTKRRHPGNREETTPEERAAQTKLDAQPPEKIAPPPEKKVGTAARMQARMLQARMLQARMLQEAHRRKVEADREEEVEADRRKKEEERIARMQARMQARIETMETRRRKVEALREVDEARRKREEEQIARMQARMQAHIEPMEAHREKEAHQEEAHHHANVGLLPSLLEMTVPNVSFSEMNRGEARKSEAEARKSKRDQGRRQEEDIITCMRHHRNTIARLGQQLNSWQLSGLAGTVLAVPMSQLLFFNQDAGMMNLVRKTEKLSPGEPRGQAKHLLNLIIETGRKYHAAQNELAQMREQRSS